MIKKLTKLFTKTSNNQLLHTVDLHSHLIPGIDDGVKSFEESIDILRALSELGFSKVITTPHIMSHRFPNTKDKILEVYSSLQREIEKAKLNIEVDIAAEYYYDEHFVELIEKQELMTFADNYILFELSYTLKPFMLEQSVAKLLSAGYKPILAHPERYTYYRDIETYKRVKDMGLLFQLNAVSLGGFYGKSVKKSAHMLINEGVIDFIGSDIHSHKYLDAFKDVLKSSAYRSCFEKNNIQNRLL